MSLSAIQLQRLAVAAFIAAACSVSVVIIGGTIVVEKYSSAAFAVFWCAVAACVLALYGGVTCVRVLDKRHAAPSGYVVQVIRFFDVMPSDSEVGSNEAAVTRLRSDLIHAGYGDLGTWKYLAEIGCVQFAPIRGSTDQQIQAAFGWASIAIRSHFKSRYDEFFAFQVVDPMDRAAA